MVKDQRRVAEERIVDQVVSSYNQLLAQLLALQESLLVAEASSQAILHRVDARHRPSAANLLHYLCLRRGDVRPLQRALSAAGLSSLGRAESHVIGSLHAIIVLLQRALGLPAQGLPASAANLAAEGASVLAGNSRGLLGQPAPHRQVNLMVTLPGEVADDYAAVRDMLIAGMDCARINCAHDKPEVWSRLVDQVRLASHETGRHCRVLMDLGGPKLRTGPLDFGSAVLKWRPARDVYGQVTAPARIWLHPEHELLSCSTPADTCVPVRGDWLARAAVHDRIELTDARGAKRSLTLVGQVGNGFWAESAQTTYLRPGIELNLCRASASGTSRRTSGTGYVGALPQQPEVIRLFRGDKLILSREMRPGLPAQYDVHGNLTRLARISCSLPEVFTCVKPGERILFDDGSIGGVIREVHPAEIVVEITQARDHGEKLLADKGINLPDSQLLLDGLTAKDLIDLNFIADKADMVALSFARRPDDVRLLRKQLQGMGAESLGVVLKIETRAAFDRLPELLLALMESPNVGVMIARGDLAVECGYERLAELQEEILWLAEAAHLPVIWATQVLEGLAKDGKPSRAEITDAAMGERAECVMLNKGPHIIEAIRTLDDILHRMQGHQHKKRALLKRLSW